MQEELARPVVEVVRFPDGKVLYEMFAFGSEIAVVPVGNKVSKSRVLEMARVEMTKTLRDRLSISPLEIDLLGEKSATIYVPDSMIGSEEVYLNAGDAILFVDSLCHGSSRRVNKGERRVVIYRYGPSWGFFRNSYRPSKELLNRLSKTQRNIVMPHEKVIYIFP